jgi:prephenate dehydrogenase
MWRDICIANREALSAMLGRFSVELTDLAESIRRGDGEQLLAIFERAKAARDRYVDGALQAASTSPTEGPGSGYEAEGT